MFKRLIQAFKNKKSRRQILAAIALTVGGLFCLGVLISLFPAFVAIATGIGVAGGFFILTCSALAIFGVAMSFAGGRSIYQLVRGEASSVETQGTKLGNNLMSFGGLIGGIGAVSLGVLVVVANADILLISTLTALLSVTYPIVIGMVIVGALAVIAGVVYNSYHHKTERSETEHSHQMEPFVKENTVQVKEAEQLSYSNGNVLTKVPEAKVDSKEPNKNLNTEEANQAPTKGSCVLL